MTTGNARVRNTIHRPANRTSPLGRLGSWCYRHRKLVVLAWIGVLVVFSLLGRSAGAQFKDDLSAGNTQSQQAATFLQEQFPAQAGASTEVVFRSQDPIGSPSDRALVTRTLDALRAVPHVSSVNSPFGPGGARQVSADGHIAYGVIQFDGTLDAIPNSAINAVVHRAQAADRPGFEAQLAGTPIEKVENPAFGISEGLGLLAAIIILLLAFGSVIAMALPIATAVVAVASMFGALDLLSHVLTVPSFGPELAALVGLGVGIDYALFVVTRYRHSLHDGATPEAAVKTAMSTSGRAVIFAGSTVVLSLLGLFLLGLPFIYGASLGAVAAVLLVMLASLTLLPALLGFTGTNIDRLHVGLRRNQARAGGRATFWWRWSRQVQRRPWVTGGAALLALAVLAVPFVSMRLAFTDAGTDPTSYTTRQAYDLLAQGFGPGSAGPLIITAELPAGGDPGVVSRLGSDLATLQDVKSVSPAQYNAAGNAAVITVIPRTSPQDARTSALVQQIRQDVIPGAVSGTGIRALVGGATAASIDTTDVISRHLAVVLAVVILLAVLLLMAAFRSVVIPLASALMTLVSTGAAYGVIVAVFQWGWLGPAIDNHTTAPVDPWIPVMLFALLFGLSMDYQVFLISRIREAWRSGRGNSGAVADGLASTGRVITSAAAIMVCVFGAFVLGDLRILKVFGFAMAVAIALDATLVRMVLLPAALQLFGRANWWFPKRLDRLVPDLMPEGDHEVPPDILGPRVPAGPEPDGPAHGALSCGMDRAPAAGGPPAKVPASAENLSQAAARRIALAAQGFGRPRGAGAPTEDDLVAAVGRLGLMQLDSVNVLCRSHYLPLFSRLGRYDRSELDRVTGHSDRTEETRDGAAGLRLVEYWAHQASLIPAGLHPLFRWRMARVDQELWAPVVKVAREQPDLVDRALAMVQERGPIPASAIGTVRQAARPGQLWNWHAGKSALEYLFYAGKVAVSGRVNFERMYDAPERVLPASVMARPAIPEADAQRELVRVAASALGVAAEPDLGDYFRLPRAASKARVAELVADGELVPVSVDGWKTPAYLWPDAARRDARPARALLSPFDSLIWFRERTERLFGFRYHVEIYTPAAKRVHGYYVLPFLLGDELVARVDLKSDRKAGALIVQAAYAEPGADRAAVARELAAELAELATWLGLAGVLVTDHGDLAGELAAVVR